MKPRSILHFLLPSRGKSKSADKGEGKEVPVTPTKPACAKTGITDEQADIANWPSAAERERFQSALADLAYVKSGTISEIARRLSCSRQHAHQVIHSTVPFAEKGHTARMVWELLAMIVENDSDRESNKKILQALQAGDDVELITDDSGYAAFILRRCRTLGVEVTMVVSKTDAGENLYLYTTKASNLTLPPEPKGTDGISL